MILSNLKMALVSLTHNKLRSILTILGVVVGVGAIVTVISIGDGVKNQVQSEVNGLGVNLLDIISTPAGQPLTNKNLHDICETPHIEACVPMMYIQAIPSVGNMEYSSAVITATHSSIKNIISQPLQAGRYFDSDDSHEVVIGSDIAQQLFGGGSFALNKNIKLTKKLIQPSGSVRTIDNYFKVVGIYKQLGDSSNFGPGIELDQAIYVPWTLGQEYTNVTRIDEVDTKVDNTTNLSVAETDINNVLKNDNMGKNDFSILTSQSLAQGFSGILNTVTNFIMAIAAVSILVGGIGIMNIMLTSVSERIREIGIRKSIGARRRTILMQFLIEAVSLTLIGGLIGIIGAYAMSSVVRMYTKITPHFTTSSFILAVAVSILIGVIFGIIPAIKAANKRPVEALRQN